MGCVGVNGLNENIQNVSKKELCEGKFYAFVDIVNGSQEKQNVLIRGHHFGLDGERIEVVFCIRTVSA